MFQEDAYLLSFGKGSVMLGSKRRVAYVLLGIFLGELGIHNFYAGYRGRGFAQVLVTFIAGWLMIPLIGVWIWALVEVCTVSQDAEGNQFA